MTSLRIFLLLAISVVCITTANAVGISGFDASFTERKGVSDGADVLSVGPGDVVYLSVTHDFENELPSFMYGDPGFLVVSTSEHVSIVGTSSLVREKTWHGSWSIANGGQEVATLSLSAVAEAAQMLEIRYGTKTVDVSMQRPVDARERRERRKSLRAEVVRRYNDRYSDGAFNAAGLQQIVQEINEEISKGIDSLGDQPVAMVGAAGSPVSIELSELGSGPVDNITSSVFDAAGRLVSNDLRLDAGDGKVDVTWDGRRSDGSSAPSGMYFLRVDGLSATSVTRIVVVR